MAASISDASPSLKGSRCKSVGFDRALSSLPLVKELPAPQSSLSSTGDALKKLLRDTTNDDEGSCELSDGCSGGGGGGEDGRTSRRVCEGKDWNGASSGGIIVLSLSWRARTKFT